MFAFPGYPVLGRFQQASSFAYLTEFSFSRFVGRWMLDKCPPQDKPETGPGM